MWTFTTVGLDRLKSAPAKVTRHGNRYTIMGAAWGAPIAAVQVRIDEGPWSTATLYGRPRARSTSSGLCVAVLDVRLGAAGAGRAPCHVAGLRHRRQHAAGARTTRSSPAGEPTGRATGKSPARSPSPDSTCRTSGPGDDHWCMRARHRTCSITAKEAAFLAPHRVAPYERTIDCSASSTATMSDTMRCSRYSAGSCGLSLSP